MTIADRLVEFRDEVSIAESLRQKANTTGLLNNTELYILYEATFLRIFRAYENFLESVFLSYLVGEESIQGSVIKTYVTPNNLSHARDIITSSQNFLDWTQPPTIIRRSEIYLENGGPIKLAVTGYQSNLKHAKKLRNHIAHNSKESEREYISVVQHFLLTLPTPLPSVGEFLSKIPTAGPCKNREILSFFSDVLVRTAEAAAEA